MDEYPAEGIVSSGTGEESLDDGRIVFDVSARNCAVVHEPVCGVGLLAVVGLIARFENVDYYFCGEDCRKKFVDNPVQYVGSRR